ncbi:MAG: hypothetical protein Q8867_08525 [Bacteroidota bacterium]|nr:hypothetical protein [Bacteroidota bacterium]
MTDIIVPVSFFAMVLGIVYILVRKKERMALIARGANPSLFESKKNVPSSLKWGLLFVGIGIGILLGRLFATVTCMGEEASYFSMICLFGGLSLVTYYIIAARIEKNNKPDHPDKPE